MRWVESCVMRDVLDDEEDRKLSKIAIVAMATTAVLSSLILFNVLFGQGDSHRRMDGLLAEDIPAGASTRVDVLASSAKNTITLTYDPVVEQVQRELLAAGYYKGSVDGVMGKKTKQAIETYQQGVSISVTGEASPDLVEHIKYTRQISAAAEFTGSIDKAADQIPADNPATVETVQMSLSSMGYEPGPINGKLTEQTQSAILKFAMDRSLPMEPKITSELLAELAKSSDQDETTMAQ
jgi:peptidoglycan hydrolase-like protein with peptidoglycan-binding domain